MPRVFKPYHRPTPDEVIEVSRRVTPQQRALFRFLNPLQSLMAKTNSKVVASAPETPRVVLISRFDRLSPDAYAKIAGLNVQAINSLFKVEAQASCDEDATVTLRDPVLVDQGDGWQTVQMPIKTSDRPLATERPALTKRIDTVLSEEGSLWTPEAPSLQIVDFSAQPHVAEAVLEYVHLSAPRQTEVFGASIRILPQP